ncbi:MAG: hypothetical protein ACRD0G_02550, partial [Acidimicrobiales bacterium]
SGDATSATAADGGGGRGPRRDDPAFEDAILEYAECMRDQGIDFPDPQIDDGRVTISRDDGGEPGSAEAEEFEAADEQCRSIMEDVMGDFEPPSAEEQERMREEALEFSECMREHGIDMPDPVFADEGDGRVGVAIGGEDSPGGFDPEDPEFQEAADECGGGLISVEADADEDDE